MQVEAILRETLRSRQKEKELERIVSFHMKNASGGWERRFSETDFVFETCMGSRIVFEIKLMRYDTLLKTRKKRRRRYSGQLR